MTRRAWDYRWSSAAAHVQGRDDILVKVQPMLERVANWTEFLGQGLSPAELDTIRRHNRTGRPLGSLDFLASLEKTLNRRLTPLKSGPKGPWKHK